MIEWPDSAFPTWKGVVARPYASGGTQAQHLAHVSRLRYLAGVPMPAAAPTSTAIAPPVVVSNNEPKNITLFGATFAPGASDVSESLYSGGVGSNAATAPAGGFSGDPSGWPDSAFPVWNGVVARPKAHGGNATQHAAHVARLKGATFPTAARAPGAAMFDGMSNTKKYLLIGGAVVAVGGVAYLALRPRRGVLGMFDKAKRKIGL